MSPPPPALSHEALLGKSQHYIQRALARKDSNDFEEYQLWASLALELLGKARLAHIHPSLIADPTHASSLFAASGVIVSTDFKTINAHTIFERLKVVVEGFDERSKEFCIEIAQRRNAELHSGEASFRPVRAEAWEAQYWHAVELILVAMGSTLDQWIGAEAAAAPKALLEHARRARADATRVRIQRIGEAFARRRKVDRDAALARAATMSTRERGLVFAASVDHVWTCDCPACGGLASLGGELVEEEVLDTSHEEYSAWESVRQYFSANELHCPACALDLFGYDEVVAAGIDPDYNEDDDRELKYQEEYNNE